MLVKREYIFLDEFANPIKYSKVDFNNLINGHVRSKLTNRFGNIDILIPIGDYEISVPDYNITLNQHIG